MINLWEMTFLFFGVIHQMSNTKYLRKWRVTATLSSGSKVVLSDSDTDPRALKMTFFTQESFYQAIQYADITIWNPSKDTTNLFLKEGARIVLEAGYQEGKFAKIFDGKVFQPLIGTEDVVNYYLTLHCIDSDTILNKNFISFTMDAGYNQRTLIDRLCKDAKIPIPIGFITEDLNKKQFQRGIVIFEGTKKRFGLIAKDNNATYTFVNGVAIMSKMSDVSKDTPLTISPATGLIGTPEAIDFGATFRCLLDPTIVIKAPAMLIKIDNTLIRQRKLEVMNNLPTVIDQDGIYQVAGVSNVGDTRGRDWYTQVIGINSKGKLPAYLLSGNSRI